MTAQEASAWKTAFKMVRIGLPPPIVHAATGLCRNRLRDLYRYVHGKSAPQGRMSEYAYRRLRTKDQRIEGLTFFKTYYSLGGDRIFQTLDHDLTVDAYLAYRDVAVQEIDSITAWYIARDLRGGVLSLKLCKTCGEKYLYDPRSEMMVKCPACGG